MDDNKKIILASSSPARRMLMERLQVPFTSLSPNIDETPHHGEEAHKLVVRLAKEKANVFVGDYQNGIIIGVDQVGVLDGNIIGKPLTHNNAVQQLLSMSGKTIQFYIGICLLNTATHQHITSLETFSVTFRSLTQQMIENYLAKEPALQCAGSLQVEGLGIVLLEKLCGDDYTALIGLPLIRLSEMLKAYGVQLP